MTRLTILAICISLIGCEARRDANAWDANCTEDQMKKVERETGYCVDNSLLDRAYCYEFAIGRNCTAAKLP